MKRKHAMPFGTDFLTGGCTRFRLWAPKPQRVDLWLNGDVIPMNRAAGRWFELTNPATPGSLYQFVIDGDLHVPDPASRFQPNDVHGPSEVVDPAAFEWTDGEWRGRPWEEAVIYELHVGTFSHMGTYAGVEERLDYLAELGVTAVELMPVADFFGKRNWGYDGVLPYAPDSVYRRPDDLKRLIQSAHRRGLMMFLDVVYNHFGPEGNYLRAYAPQFFTSRHSTPWGDGINFDGDDSRTVRDFLIHNALYWLEEFHFDGLRFDAVHAIKDDSSPDILEELAATIRNYFPNDRHIHLVLENDDNAAHYLRRNSDTVRGSYDAQWNDDIHHACQVINSGETDGYYHDYADRPIDQLGKCLTQGFVFQGQPSPFRHGKKRGEPSADLPPTRFVSFQQNHDQVGNRALGERISTYANEDAVRAMAAILLLAPSPPLLFMGEEFAASTPFLFFCNFEGDLAKAVTEGRRNEFARFEQFRDESMRSRIPDPNAESTFSQCKLDWESVHEGRHSEWRQHYRQLLELRKKHIVPMLSNGCDVSWRASYSVSQKTCLSACWQVRDLKLHLVANLGIEVRSFNLPKQQALYVNFEANDTNQLPPWSVAWFKNS